MTKEETRSYLEALSAFAYAAGVSDAAIEIRASNNKDAKIASLLEASDRDSARNLQYLALLNHIHGHIGEAPK